MILTQYLEFRAGDLQSSRSHFERVMLAVHSHNSTGSKLVVDWPKWASSANYFGPCMRVFGAPVELEILREALDKDQAKRKPRAANQKALHIGPISDVPANAGITWMFVRDRKPSRSKSRSGAARLARRAIARGETPKEYTPEEVEAHTLMLVSLSTNKTFPMDISRVRPTHLDALNSTPNSYGLGVPVPRF
jgi:hypothetical protein